MRQGFFIAGLRRGARWMGWSLVVTALLSGAASCGAASDVIGAWIGGRTVEGTVVEIRRKMVTTRGQRHQVEQAVVTFRAPDGRSVTIEDPVQRAHSPHRVGTRVRVRMDPDRPDDAILAGSTLASAGGATVGMILVPITLAFGALLLAVARAPWQASER